MSLPSDAEIEPVLQKALDLQKPVVVDCEIPIDDKVLPMVAPGSSIDDVILSVDPISD
jgi:acetolactate synthase-1/2/3 large subunit